MKSQFLSPWLFHLLSASLSYFVRIFAVPFAVLFAFSSSSFTFFNRFAHCPYRSLIFLCHLRSNTFACHQIAPMAVGIRFFGVDVGRFVYLLFVTGFGNLVYNLISNKKVSGLAPTFQQVGPILNSSILCVIQIPG